MGTFLPNAGGTSLANRDIQMTTIDPYDYDDNSFSGHFLNIQDPEIQVWNNVTYADNYYQTNGSGNTINGRELSGTNWKADWNVSLNNLAGFVPDDGEGASHRDALAWYAGTANLNESQFPSENGETIYRRLGDLEQNNIADVTKTWYTPDHTNASFTQGDTKAPWEGIGTGWFHSVLGGGSEFRPYDLDGYKFSLDEIQEFGYPNGWKNYLEGKRVSVTEDNTPIPAMRGDFAVPTLFNGNFDAIAAKLDSQPIPAWSLYNGDNKSVLQSSLVNAIGSNSGSTNYALELKSGESITHNPFVIPDWGNLRFDVHAPVASGKLRVTLETIDGNFQEINEIDLGQGERILLNTVHQW
ncbi:hypothetical protein QUB40_29375 [Microcoleus sp. AT9_A2]|uniref:hypothetical protein n=1 Tax=Microcoleus sp. AT9_A2 TaxID=2818624 RepID=UPI002FD4537D